MRNFLVREFFHFAQEQHLPIDERQIANRVLESIRIPPALRCLRRVYGRFVDRAVDGQPIVAHDLRRPVAAVPIIKSTPHDGQEPGFGIGAAHRIEVLERPDTRVLDDILGVVRVPRQPARQVVRGVQVRQDQCSKSTFGGHVGCSLSMSYLPTGTLIPAGIHYAATQ